MELSRRLDLFYRSLLWQYHGVFQGSAAWGRYLLRLIVMMGLLYLFLTLLPAPPSQRERKDFYREAALRADGGDDGKPHKQYSDDYEQYDQEIMGKAKGHKDAVQGHEISAQGAKNRAKMIDEVEHRAMASSLHLDNPIQPTVKAGFEFSFVLGVGPKFVKQVMDTVASIQYHYPEKPILLYNWGVEHNQLKHWCNVTLRHMNLTKFVNERFQGDMGKLSYRAAAVWSMIHALRTRPTIVWVDPGVVFTRRLSKGGISTMVDNSGLLFVKSHEGISEFRLRKGTMGLEAPPSNEAGVMLLMRTPHMCDNVLWWWYLCTLRTDCVLPTFTSMCDPEGHENYQLCDQATQILSQLGGNFHDLFVSNQGWRYRKFSEQLSTDTGSHAYTLQKC